MGQVQEPRGVGRGRFPRPALPRRSEKWGAGRGPCLGSCLDSRGPFLWCPVPSKALPIPDTLPAEPPSAPASMRLTQLSKWTKAPQQ